MAKFPKKLATQLTCTIEIPIEVSSVPESKGLTVRLNADLRKALKFTRKMAKLCARHGYSVEVENDVQDLCDRQQEG